MYRIVGISVYHREQKCCARRSLSTRRRSYCSCTQCLQLRLRATRPLNGGLIKIQKRKIIYPQFSDWTHALLGQFSNLSACGWSQDAVMSQLCSRQWYVYKRLFCVPYIGIDCSHLLTFGYAQQVGLYPLSMSTFCTVHNRSFYAALFLPQFNLKLSC